MKPRIENLKHKKLVGHKRRMSLTHDKTQQLWRGFAPKIKGIKQKVSDEKISMQVYEASYFSQFDPNREFEKWAAVELHSFDELTEDMEIFELTGGTYAVFDHKGSSNDKTIFEYIFTTWLPESPYELDDRPHFEVLGSKYKNKHSESEEEIWIPIKNTDV